MGQNRFKRGDWVQVLSEAQILQTLDRHGALDGMPFMPEMRPFCGRRLRVAGRSGRICVESAWMRELDGFVFLEDARCDGSAHDGCQRGCLAFWHWAWLQSADGPGDDRTLPVAAGTDPAVLTTREADGRYRCQSTALLFVARPFKGWGFRPFLSDILSGNISLRAFAARAAGAAVRRVKRFAGLKEAWAGNPSRTPGQSLGLQPGDLVQVRSREEILATLDAQGKNRGMGFEAPMLDHCGGRYRVRGRIERIILEATGEMRNVKDTVALEGTTCSGCPRNNLFYWREVWLSRLPDEPGVRS